MSATKHEIGIHCGETSVSQLTPDCAKCCGLCCVGPSFEVDQGFGYSKPAHTACRHLEADFRCHIHHELRPRGFPACAQFSCYGAGQRVTNRLFRGLSWRTSPEVASRMFSAYSRVRMLHESMAMLEWASARVSPAAATRLRTYSRHIGQLCESTDALPSASHVAQIRRRVLAVVRSALRAHWI